MAPTPYYGYGCEEAKDLKFFDDEPGRFVAFSLQFIIPGWFPVEGSQLVNKRFDFLVAESYLVRSCKTVGYMRQKSNGRKSGSMEPAAVPKYIKCQAVRTKVATAVTSVQQVISPNVQNNVPQAPPPANPSPVKRHPGRPRGTKNRPKVMTMKPAIPQAVPNTCSQQLLNACMSEPAQKPKLPKRKRKAAVKRQELSMTISVVGGDISPQVFPLIQEILNQWKFECESGVFAVERGGTLLNLHVQGVIALQCSSALDAKKRITAALKWNEDRPVGAGVCVKKLTNKRIHSFVGMVGYCLKDKKELHFRVAMKNISDPVQREGMLLFTFYDAADLKTV
ncbi:hypothetical protein R1sor_021170 [Riccia sorocarpa]|uniref:Replitron HUH endonuclease domain-containing protein n=1 Tax=Riccia sorocarpa TaxID=122646 RepID=A0ABD3GM04_9MARC